MKTPTNKDLKTFLQVAQQLAFQPGTKKKRKNPCRRPAGARDRQAEHRGPRKPTKAGAPRKNPARKSFKDARRIGRQLIAIKTTQGKLKVNGKASVWGLPNGSIFLKGFFTTVPKGTVKQIDYLDEAKAKREGKNPPDRPWRHDFSKERKPLSRTRGGLLIKAGSKPLWGKR